MVAVAGDQAPSKLGVQISLNPWNESQEKFSVMKHFSFSRKNMKNMYYYINRFSRNEKSLEKEINVRKSVQISHKQKLGELGLVPSYIYEDPYIYIYYISMFTYFFSNATLFEKDVFSTRGGSGAKPVMR